MYPYMQEVEKIKDQIERKFHPQNILLFGSCAKGMITSRSDIDICVVMYTDNKRKLIQNMLLEVDSEKDLDIVIYTPGEWEQYKNDKSTLVNIIFTKGVSLLG